MIDRNLADVPVVVPIASPSGLLPEIDLGDDSTSAVVQRALRARRGRRAWLVSWKGSKIPRGAEIEGSSVVWTQHGVVRDEGGREMGTYLRLEEWSGPDGNQHEMVVFGLEQVSDEEIFSEAIGQAATDPAEAETVYADVRREVDEERLAGEHDAHAAYIEANGTDEGFESWLDDPTEVA